MVKKNNDRNKMEKIITDSKKIKLRIKKNDTNPFISKYKQKRFSKQNVLQPHKNKNKEEYTKL